MIPSPKWRVERRRLNPQGAGNVLVETEFMAGAAVAFNTLEVATTQWRSPSPSLRSQRIGCHHHTGGLNSDGHRSGRHQGLRHHPGPLRITSSRHSGFILGNDIAMMRMRSTANKILHFVSLINTNPPRGGVLFISDWSPAPRTRPAVLASPGC